MKTSKIDTSNSFKSKKVFESRATKTFKKLHAESRVTNLSKKASAKLDNDLAEAMIKIEAEFRRKAAASWKAIKGIILD